MPTTTVRRMASLLAAAAACAVAVAQAAADDTREFEWEVGFEGGVSVAYGDVNHSSPLYNPSAAGGIVLRYNANPRWSVVAEGATLGLKGDSRDFSGRYPEGARPRFDSRLWGLTVRPEFTFWNYGWASDYRDKQRVAPFLTAGVGLMVATGDGDGATLATPLGLGLRWKVAPRWNVQLTTLFARLWSDTADGVADPMGIGSESLKGADWTGTVMLGVTFDFKQRCVECRNQKTL